MSRWGLEVTFAATVFLWVPVAIQASSTAPPASRAADTVIVTAERAAASSVAFSPDGRRLASSGEDGRVHVWDAATGGELRVLDAHRGEAYGVAFSPDGTRIATGGQDGTVRIWDTASGRLERSWEAEPWPMDLAFSPSGDQVASSGLDGRVRIVQLDGADDARRTSAAAELQQESGPDLLRRAVDGLLPDSLRTEVLVLGSTHLSRYSDRFRPEQLDRLIAALEAWDPDAVGVERDPPEVHGRIGAGPEPEVGRAMQERLGVELDRAVAVSDSLLDRAEGGETLVDDDRLALVRYLVAAHRLPTATLHWMRLSEDMRAEADLPEQARQALEARADGPANEIYSLGLRLAREGGLEQVHPIDDATSERVLDLERAAAEGGLRERLADHPTYEPLADYMGEERRRVSEAIEGGDLLPYYRWKNDPETVARDVRLQWGIFLELAPELPLAQKRIAHWEIRNLKMAAHIRKMTLHHPGERILVVVGAGHKAFFDAYLEQMLDVELVQLEEVLFS